MTKVIKEIEKQLDDRVVSYSTDDLRFIRFKTSNRTWWAKLTKTGKLKKYSIRIDVYN